MTQRIEVPGMGVVEFPAGMSDEEISAVIQRELGGAEAQSSVPTPPSDPLDGFLNEFDRAGMSAIYGGLTAIPRMVMEGGNWLQERYPLPGAIPIPGYEAIAGADASIREAIRPQSRSGKTAANIGEAAVGGMLGPGLLSAPGRLASIGASAGAGSELAQAALGEGAIPSIAGGLLGGGLGGLAAAAKTNRASLAQEALEGVRPDALQEALTRMETARRQGFEGNISQFMPEPSNLDAYSNALSSSRHGTITQQQLRDQPGQVAARAEQLVEALPGERLPAQILANEAQEAATAALAQTRRRAGDAWRELAPADDVRFPESALLDLDERLQSIAASAPHTHRGQMAEDVRQVLRVGDPETPLLGPDGVPLEEALWNDRALNLKDSINQQLSTFGARKLNTPSDRAGDQAAAQEIRNLFNEMVETYVPELKAANDAYSAVMQTYNSQRKSITGSIAGRQGALSDVNAPQGRLMAMFDAGTVPGAPSEILTFERDLRRAGQQDVYLNAAKTWIADRASKAVARPTASSRAPEDAAVNLLKVFGDPRSLDTPAGQKAAQGFNDTLAGMARSLDLDADETASYVKGFRNFMEIVTDLSNRPASVAGPSRAQIESRAQEGLTRNIGQVSIITPLRQPALAWARWLEQDALSAMDKLMTSPEGVQTLVELGRTQPFSQKALTTFGTFLGTSAATVGSDGISDQ